VLVSLQIDINHFS